MKMMGESRSDIDGGIKKKHGADLDGKGGREGF